MAGFLISLSISAEAVQYVRCLALSQLQPSSQLQAAITHTKPTTAVNEADVIFCILLFVAETCCGLVVVYWRDPGNAKNNT